MELSDPAKPNAVGLVAQLVLVPAVLLCAAGINDFLRHVDPAQEKLTFGC